MLREPPFLSLRAVVTGVLALTLAACGDPGTLDPDVPGATPLDPSAVVLPTSGTANLLARVVSNGTAVPGAVVTIVLVAENGGPLWSTATDAAGEALFQSLPNGVSVCVHARYNISLEQASEEVFPNELGSSVPEFAGTAKAVATAIATSSGSVPYSLDNYKDHCLDNPAVALSNGQNTVAVELDLTDAAVLVAQVLDVEGNPTTALRGVVGVGFTCAERTDGVPVPWVASAGNCDGGVYPGFLHMVTRSDTLYYPLDGGPFRVESMEGTGLVATAGFTGGLITGPVELLGGPVVCDNRHAVEDAPGDASALDIVGDVAHSIGVGNDNITYFDPDPSVTIVKFDVTVAAGRIDYNSRTVFQGEKSTRSLTASFDVNADGTCTAAQVSGSATRGPGGSSADVYCAPYLDGTTEMVRVTVIEDRGGRAFSTSEFNVQTNPAIGNGDSTFDPSRNGGQRAWIAFISDSTCPIEYVGDDRLKSRL